MLKQMTRVRSRKVSMGFLRERDFSRDQPCETETSRETTVRLGSICDAQFEGKLFVTPSR